MAQLLNPFDATQWNPAQSSGQLPIGNKQVCQIIASEVKANSANDGGFLEFTLEILDGPNVGSTGAYRLNLYNQSQKAVEIAHRQMSALCHVVGIFNVSDTSALHQKPFRIDVGYQKGQDPATNPDANGYTEVKKVYDINGNEPGKAPAAPQAAPAPAVQPGIAPAPWAGGQTAHPAAPVQTQAAPPPAAAPPWGQPATPASQPPAGFPAQNAPAPAPPWGAPQ